MQFLKKGQKVGLSAKNNESRTIEKILLVSVEYLLTPINSKGIGIISLYIFGQLLRVGIQQLSERTLNL